MSDAFIKFFIWVPRILVILFAIFISLFALDMFGEKRPFLHKIAGFFIHLIPTFIILISLIVAWRFSFIGGVLYIIVGAVFTLQFKTYKKIGNFVLISLPLFLVGALFIISAIVT